VPELLMGDPGRLRQVIINLVGNAIKFTEQGEVVVRVEMRSQSDKQVVLHFAVSDTGIGIPIEKQQDIFRPFEQADGSIGRKFGGTGLGLAISSQLVERMGGRIWVESEMGKGSTFHFTAQFGLQKEYGRKSIPKIPANIRDVDVLVVDDNVTNRRLLQEVLTHWQMKPKAVENGKAALAILKQAREAGKPFALVLLDCHMPEMDGFTLAEEIKKDPELAGTPIVMQTSAGQRGDGARCRQLGVAAYLTKPIKQSELLSAIVAALRVSSPKESHPTLITRHSLREGRSRLQILLAEDNVINQKLVVLLLEKWGHEVQLAQNGREALTLLEREPFHLVLMDVQMPELDGLETTRLIRRKEKETGGHIPIVAMTAHAMKGDRERCLEAGMDDYISKPVKPMELLEIIGRVLGQAAD